MASVISGCRCSNDYQDQRYGKGQRVFNSTNGGFGRCTVCGAEVKELFSKVPDKQPKGNKK